MRHRISSLCSSFRSPLYSRGAASRCCSFSGKAGALASLSYHSDLYTWPEPCQNILREIQEPNTRSRDPLEKFRHPHASPELKIPGKPQDLRQADYKLVAVSRHIFVKVCFTYSAYLWARKVSSAKLFFVCVFLREVHCGVPRDCRLQAPKGAAFYVDNVFYASESKFQNTDA